LALDLAFGGGDVVGAHVDAELLLDPGLHRGRLGIAAQFGQRPPHRLLLAHAFLRGRRPRLAVRLLRHVRLRMNSCPGYPPSIVTPSRPGRRTKGTQTAGSATAPSVKPSPSAQADFSPLANGNLRPAAL